MGRAVIAVERNDGRQWVEPGGSVVVSRSVSSTFFAVTVTAHSCCRAKIKNSVYGCRQFRGLPPRTQGAHNRLSMWVGRGTMEGSTVQRRLAAIFAAG